jgi:hypothetical protein
MGEPLRFTQTVEVTSTDCIHCGFDVLMPASFKTQRRNDHKTFHCTSCGGSMHWPAGTSETEKLRKELESAQRQATFHRENAASERAAREKTERRLSATRGAKTRIVNRIKNGVCPCCNRTFVNLLQHMSTQHPEFQKQEAADSR